MVRKKSGSTLITTIILFGTLLTVGMALISMSLGEYKMMKSENKRTRNLYGADSGLDVAYDIIVRDFDSAAQFAAFRVKQLEAGKNPVNTYQEPYTALQNDIKTINEDNTKTAQEKLKLITGKRDKMDVLKNREFRRSFKSFIYDDSKGKEKERDSSTFDYSIPNMLFYSLEGKESDGINRNFIVGLEGKEVDSTTKERNLTDNIEKKDDFVWSQVDLVSNDGKSEPSITVELSTYPKIENTCEDYESDKDSYDKDYEIRLTSIFITKERNVDVNGENKRTAQVVYKLKVPDYKDVIFGESQVKEYKAYKDKGIIIGGNMTVGENTSGDEFDLKVDGNIFVQGNADSTSLSNKYNGGISLNNLNKVNFDGNVVTGKTFNMGKNVQKADISKNLYAGNVYAGDKDNLNNFGDECTLNVAGDMVLNNDLTLKATNTHITTDNFYGINDERTEDSTANNTNKVKNSSSIIVNNSDPNPSSSIVINNNALIMGVAYINTGTEQGYSTGESVGVKGNYNAYSEHVDSDNENDNNIEFDQDHEAQSPLYLLNGEVFKKDKHFFDYWNGKAGLLDGGVLFGDISKVNSVGSIVYRTKDSDTPKVKKGSGAIDKELNCTQQKKEYALRVYNMNMEEISGNLDDKYLGLYNDPPKKSPLDDLMSFPRIEDDDKFKDGKAKKIGDLNNGLGIFNPNEGQDINIVESETGGDIEVSDIDGDGTITISVPSGKTLKAFIATAGTVNIQGAVKIDGNIIAKKDLIINGSGDKEITYDKKIAEYLQQADDGLAMFKQVFGSGDEDLKNLPNETEIVVQYDLDKFLKNLLWKLVK